MEWHFSALSGVTGTEVGYTGGTSKNPTYTNLDGHTESIQIIFDPSKVSYEDLLRHFWSYRDHTGRYKTQYESAIFAHGEEQLAKARASKAVQEKNSGLLLRVRIEPAGPFYQAEEYHQHYYAKLKGLTG